MLFPQSNKNKIPWHGIAIEQWKNYTCVGIGPTIELWLKSKYFRVVENACGGAFGAKTIPVSPQ